MIPGLYNSGALPTLERFIQFTGQRHRVLVDSIANLSTPYFKPRDLDPASFQAALREAIDQRRASADAAAGPLPLADTDQVAVRPDRLEPRPGPTHDGILFHDQNNRDLERLMQHLAENTMAHRMGIELIRSEMTTLQTAIRGRL